MSWAPSYHDKVLAPDYAFAGRYLLSHILRTLSAHLETVARIPLAQTAGAQAQIAQVRASLEALSYRPLPVQAADVPDAFYAIQRELEADVGEAAAGWSRLGLSRNDFDMTVYKMRGRELLLVIGTDLLDLRAALLRRAEEHLDTVLIAKTHHQPGQPSTVAHYLGAVEALLERDTERLMGAYQRLNRCPMGAAALAGSSHPLDRAFTAELLGFDGPVANTYDAVASSDWEIETAAVSQSVALNLSRFVCDLLSWASLGWYRLGDGLVQGSSIMPQKRNPVALEHARTRFSRVMGAAQMVMYSSHNIPFGDLNDFGPDVQGALQTQHMQLGGGMELLLACVENGDFDSAALARVAAATDTTATELADELVRSCGLPFPDAHAVVARLVARLSEAGRPLTRATPEDLAAAGGPPLDEGTLSMALDPEAFVRRRAGLGGPAPEGMKRQLDDASQRLSQDVEWLAGRKNILASARGSLRAHEKEKV